MFWIQGNKVIIKESITGIIIYFNMECSISVRQEIEQPLEIPVSVEFYKTLHVYIKKIQKFSF